MRGWLDSLEVGTNQSSAQSLSSVETHVTFWLAAVSASHTYETSYCAS